MSSTARIRAAVLSVAVMVSSAAAVHRSSPPTATPSSSHSLRSGPVALSIDHTGLYRVSGTYLRSHGIDWSGIPASRLAVVTDGHRVAREVSTSGRLSRSSWVEFYGRSIKTLYTGTAVYDLLVDRRSARAAPGIASLKKGRSRTASYPASFSEARRTQYEPMATGAHWFYTELIANGGPDTVDDHIRLSHVVRSPGVADRLAVRAWGVTDFSGPGAQHDLVIGVNSHRAAEMKFSGNVYRSATVAIPSDWLRSGTNDVRLELTGRVQNQYNLDITDVETIDLTYARFLVAQSDRITATLPAKKSTRIRGFRSRAVQLWRVAGGRTAVVTGGRVSRFKKGYEIAFVPPANGTYIAVGKQGLLHPAAVSTIPGTSYLSRGPAHLVIIAPRLFWRPLQPLVHYHQSRGMSVKVATPEDVYDAYSHGVVDGRALRRYLGYASGHLGTRDVLLVGVDTYDYHGYLNCSKQTCPANPKDKSLVPSLYARDDFYGQIPSDELMVAGKGGAPTMAIGRIPAVTRAQVKTAVAKTIRLLSAPLPAHPAAVFASGSEDPGFQSTSQALAQSLPGQFAATFAEESQLGASGARQVLLKAIKDGVRIVDFVGHGNIDQWGNPPALLESGDVSGLDNGTRPEVFFGWGCQTAYDVDPTDRALNARLLFAKHGGGALTVGSTGLDLLQPQAELAQALYTQLFHASKEQTIAEALQHAEDAILARDPSTIQPIQSYELFGDPAVPASVLGH
ncbi:MAG TPA: C25 family cysteine peptidase [Chloroflexota bacterium]|nr:C25 family cysteine peptidase [Chloroflexota bacterium]